MCAGEWGGSFDTFIPAVFLETPSNNSECRHIILVIMTLCHKVVGRQNFKLQLSMERQALPFKQ